MAFLALNDIQTRHVAIGVLTYNGHGPNPYLKDALTRLPIQRASQIAELLAHRWGTAQICSMFKAEPRLKHQALLQQTPSCEAQSAQLRDPLAPAVTLFELAQCQGKLSEVEQPALRSNQLAIGDVLQQLLRLGP